MVFFLTEIRPNSGGDLAASTEVVVESRRRRKFVNMNGRNAILLPCTF
jgi:hypothetical protein